MAVILYRYLNHIDLTLVEDASAPKVFSDVGSFSTQTKEAAEALRKYGVLTGDNSGNFNPSNLMTRAECVTVFMRLREKMLDADYPFFQTTASSYTIHLDEDSVYYPTWLVAPYVSSGAYITSSDRDILTSASSSHKVFAPKSTGTVTITWHNAEFEASATVTVLEPRIDGSWMEFKNTTRSGAVQWAGNYIRLSDGPVSIASLLTEEAQAELAKLDNPQFSVWFMRNDGLGVEVIDGEYCFVPTELGHAFATVSVAGVRGGAFSDIYVCVKTPEDIAAERQAAADALRAAQEQIAAEQAAMAKANEDWMDAQLATVIRDGMSEKEKAEVIAKLICDYMTYDYRYYNGGSRTVTISDDAPSYSEPYGVCHDYAVRYVAFCKRAGLECEYVSGTARNEGHAWNRVNCDGTWYYVDTCWMDGFGGYDANGLYGMRYCLTSNYWTSHKISGVMGTQKTIESAIILWADEPSKEVTLHVGDKFYVDVVTQQGDKVTSKMRDYVGTPVNFDSGEQAWMVHSAGSMRYETYVNNELVCTYYITFVD